MTLYVGNMDGGQTSVAGHNRKFKKVMSIDGVIVKATDLKVAQQSVASTSVDVGAGDLFITLNDYMLHAWSTATTVKAITANSSGNPRIDAVVACVDLALYTASSSNNPGAFVISVIAGTSAVSPVAPTNGEIEAAIGASNPYMRLANIAVANGFATILTANITDMRTTATFDFPQFSRLTLTNDAPLSSLDFAGTERAVLELNDNNVLTVGNNTSAVSQAVITTGGSGGAYTVSLTPAPIAYVLGMSMKIKANHASPGASTMNANGLGAVAITKNGATALASDDVLTDGLYELTHDGTQFQVSGIGGASATAATQAQVAAGTSNTLMATPLGVSRWHMPPQGFGYNYKIVPSVAASDLTVALKGIDGNDASASNPIYIRIGDTVRTITAALSVTKNDATNWCNAGSAGLATKEIDYFVYLGYNATDGVVIGFSRIPYATRYDSFSATSTAETYCAISTITTAAAGDYYEVIGRFAATLSAGAGHTWTVPTFTATNLIQRPIYETRQLSIVPNFIATTKGNGTTVGTYRLIGRTCIYYASFTLGSTSSVSSNVNVGGQPFTPVQTAGGMTSSCTYSHSGSGSGFGMVVYAGSAFYLQTNTLYAYVGTTAPFTWLVNDYMACNVVYEF